MFNQKGAYSMSGEACFMREDSDSLKAGLPNEEEGLFDEGRGSLSEKGGLFDGEACSMRLRVLS